MKDTMIITETFEDKIIVFEKQNGEIYLNATKTAKAFDKRLDKWKESIQTIEYIDSLNRYPFKGNRNWIIVKQGGNDKHAQGTWIHQKLVIMFARWLSSDFAVWCDLRIEQILFQISSVQPQNQNLQLPEIGNSTQKIIELKNDVLETSNLIEILESKKLTTLYRLDKFYRKFHNFSPLEHFEIDLDSQFFLPTELGKMINKSAVEINLMIANKGFQVRENGVWKMTSSGRDFGIEIIGKFSQIKWKLKTIV